MVQRVTSKILKMLVSYVSEHMNLKKEITDSVVPLIKYTGSDDSQMLQFFFLNLHFRQCVPSVLERTNHQNTSPQTSENDLVRKRNS